MYIYIYIYINKKVYLKMQKLKGLEFRAYALIYILCIYLKSVRILIYCLTTVLLKVILKVIKLIKSTIQLYYNKFCNKL